MCLTASTQLAVFRLLRTSELYKTQIRRFSSIEPVRESNHSCLPFKRERKEVCGSALVSVHQICSIYLVESLCHRVDTPQA